MRIGDVPDDELLSMLKNEHPAMQAEPDPWEQAKSLLRSARLPLRRGMLLLNGWVVEQGEEGNEPRENGVRVLVTDSSACIVHRWFEGVWRLEEPSMGSRGLVPDIRDPWTARMVWHDLNARFCGEDRSKTPPLDDILSLVVTTGGWEKLTMEERRERYLDMVEQQQQSRPRGGGRKL
jgi:hypothetical protein